MRRHYGSGDVFIIWLLMAIVVLLLNVAIWGGLIYFIFWCANHFGVI